MTVTNPGAAAEPGAAPPRKLLHQPALDGLRGLAVAGVLLFHGGHLVGGYLGVDAFFVLSGFLITTLLLVEHANTDRISLPRFWARRARRLLPAVLCVVGVTILYAVFIAKPHELPVTFRGDAFATVFYYANWHQIATAGGPFRAPSPLAHTWSLAIEEQFYLVWPLVLVVVLRGASIIIGARRVLALALTLAAISFLLMQVLYKSADPFRVSYGTDTRASAVLIGAALAAALVALGPITSARARRVLEVAALGAIVVLAFAWTHLAIDSAFLYRGGMLCCGIAVAIVIAASVHPQRGPVAAILSPKALRGLGIISYGVYLWHWPIFLWAHPDRVKLHGWPLFGVQCAITLVVALLSYRFVERPIRYGWARPGDVVMVEEST